MIATVEIDGGQTPLVIVHCKIFVPTATAVIPEFGKFAFAMVAPPEISVQLPVPIAGVFPASTVDVAQIV